MKRAALSCVYIQETAASARLAPGISAVRENFSLSSLRGTPWMFSREPSDEILLADSSFGFARLYNGFSLSANKKCITKIIHIIIIIYYTMREFD